jgi:hypothetical protein
MAVDTPIAAVPKRPRWLRFSLAGLLFFALCVAGVLAGARIGQQQLRLSPDATQMTISQRSSADVPGLRGLANIALKDITDGQVLVSVQDASGADIVSPTSVREGDVLSFKVRSQTFYLRLTRLVNNLVGDDFGTVEISAKPPNP